MNRYNKGFPEDKKFKLTFRFSAKMNPTEPIKRLKFGFIFLCSKYGFKSQEHSKRDLNP